MAVQHDARDEASETWSALGAAVTGAWNEARRLVAEHVRLASREAAARTSGVGLDVGLLVIAALLLHIALLAVFVTVGLALHEAGATPWLAALAVAVLAVSGAAAAGVAGRQRLLRRTRATSPTLMALRDTRAWLQSTVRSRR